MRLFNGNQTGISMTNSPSRSLSPRYGEALAFAHETHLGHVRKGTGIPYVSHLMSVSALVLEHGGDEDLAIAALLHDAIEDMAGDDPEPLKREIASRFGERVLDVVLGCSDSTSSKKPEWEARKRAYLAHLADAEPDVLLVSCADKLHNARAILGDYGFGDESFWSRFTTGRNDPAEGRRKTLWYYRELVKAFRARGEAAPPMLVALLADTVRELHLLATERGAALEPVDLDF